MFENIINILVINNGLGPFVDEQIKSISSIDKSIKIDKIHLCYNFFIGTIILYFHFII